MGNLQAAEKPAWQNRAMRRWRRATRRRKLLSREHAVPNRRTTDHPNHTANAAMLVLCTVCIRAILNRAAKHLRDMSASTASNFRL